MRDSSPFNRLAKSAARVAGKPVAFGAAAASIVLWAVSGPLFGFSDTWQLIVNTATTVITFLMVFVIQNTQNRESEATQIKLDELIRALKGAHNALLDLEEMTIEDLDKIRRKYEELAQRAREDLRRGKAPGGEAELISNGIKAAPAERKKRTKRLGARSRNGAQEER